MRTNCNETAASAGIKRAILFTKPPSALKNTFLLLLCMAFSYCALSQTVYYVKPTGSDANDGKSWNTAFQTLQQALTTTLSVAATGTGLTYQWYSNSTNSNTGGTAIANATSASFTPPNTTLGKQYYYVQVNNVCGTMVARKR
jgi:hypothetical protein